MYLYNLKTQTTTTEQKTVSNKNINEGKTRFFFLNIYKMLGWKFIETVGGKKAFSLIIWNLMKIYLEKEKINKRIWGTTMLITYYVMYFKIYACIQTI